MASRCMIPNDGEPSTLKSGSTTHMPVRSSGSSAVGENHRTNAHGYKTPPHMNEKNKRTRAAWRPQKPSSDESFSAKTQSYRGRPLRQRGVARMCSRRMPTTPETSLGAKKVAAAEWNTLIGPCKVGRGGVGESSGRGSGCVWS